VTSDRSILVIGLGNEFRSDDRVGLYVARAVRLAGLPGVRVMEGVSDAIGLIDAWDEATAVFAIDCANSGREPGFVHRFDGLIDTIPEALFSRYSTHAFGVVDALALAGTLGRLPSRLIIYGIEAESCSPGTTLAPAVQKSADDVAEAIIRQIRDIE